MWLLWKDLNSRMIYKRPMKCLKVIFAEMSPWQRVMETTEIREHHTLSSTAEPEGARQENNDSERRILAQQVNSRAQEFCFIFFFVMYFFNTYSLYIPPTASILVNHFHNPCHPTPILPLFLFWHGGIFLALIPSVAYHCQSRCILSQWSHTRQPS